MKHLQASNTFPIDIGSRLELMLDDYLIARLSGGAELRLNQPIPRDDLHPAAALQALGHIDPKDARKQVSPGKAIGGGGVPVRAAAVTTVFVRVHGAGPHDHGYFAYTRQEMQSLGALTGWRANSATGIILDTK